MTRDERRMDFPFNTTAFREAQSLYVPPVKGLKGRDAHAHDTDGELCGVPDLELNILIWIVGFGGGKCTGVDCSDEAANAGNKRFQLCRAINSPLSCLEASS